MQNAQHLATIDDHCGAIKTVEGQLEEVKISHQDLEAQRRALVEQCDEWSARNKALDSSLQALEAQRQTLGMQYAEQLTTTDALRAEIEVLKELLTGAEAKSEIQRQDFVGQNSERAARIGALEKTLAENQNKLEELRALYAEQAAAAESLSRRLPAVEDHLKETEVKLQESEAQHTALVIQHSQHLAIIDDHSSAIKIVERQLKEAQADRQGLEAQRQALVEQCDDWSARTKALDARFVETDTSLQISETQRHTLETRYAEQLSATNALRSEIELLTRLLKEVETRSEAQRQDFVNSEHTCAARITALNQTLAENERKLQESVAERHALVAQIKDDLTAMPGHYRTVWELEKRLEETEQKLQNSEAQRRALLEQCDEWSFRTRALEGRLAGINEQQVQIPKIKSLEAADWVQPSSKEDSQVIENLREQIRDKQADIDTLKQIVTEERAKVLERDKRELALKTGWISWWILSYCEEMSKLGLSVPHLELLLAFVVVALGVVYYVYC